MKEYLIYNMFQGAFVANFTAQQFTCWISDAARFTEKEANEMFEAICRTGQHATIIKIVKTSE